MSDKCPKCGIVGTKVCDRPMFIIRPPSAPMSFGEAEPVVCHIIDGPDCLRRQLAAAQAENERLTSERDQAQARYDALRINSETTIGQLRQQTKALEESLDDAESIISCVAMMARFYPRDTPIRTPVLQHDNSTLIVAVLFLAEDWLVARMDAEKRAEWERIADEMRSKIGKAGATKL